MKQRRLKYNKPVIFAVMQSENFVGFFSDWETSKDSYGFGARVSAAVGGYDPMKEDIVSYVIRESGT